MSAPTNGQSGTYWGVGVGELFCSCAGELQQTGQYIQVAVNCPTTITVSSTSTLPLATGFPSGLRTGVGIFATMMVGPGNTDGFKVAESVTNGTNNCPNNISSVCSGSSVFTVNPSSGGGSSFGIWTIPGNGDNQFLDEHAFVSYQDLLGGGPSCTQTCAQTYSACGKSIGNFTITSAYAPDSINGTSVTRITITKQ